MTVEHLLDLKQFVLDVQFLVEITKYGGYFSNNPLFLMNLMKSVFLSAGLDPRRDVNDDAWAIDSAAETIQKLLEVEKEHISLDQDLVGEEEAENQTNNAANSFQDDANTSEENALATDEPEVVYNAESESLNIEQCIDQFKNEANSFQEDARSCLEGSVEPEEDAVAKDEPEVAYNAESESLNIEQCIDQSKNEADSFQEDARSCLEGSVEPEKDAVATDEPEVAYNVDSESLNIEQCIDQSKNEIESFREDARSYLEGFVKPEDEDEVASYDPKVSFNAELASLNAAHSFQQGVTSSLEDYAELEEDALTSYDQEVAFRAETTSSLEAEPSESKYATASSEDFMQSEEWQPESIH